MNWAVAVIALSACNLLEPPLVPLEESPRIVDAQGVWSAPTDALFPTDIEALPHGGFAVLDGYRDTLLLHGADHARITSVEGAWGRPVRMAARPDGWWLTVPDQGAMILIDGKGHVLRELSVVLDDGAASPVAVAWSRGSLVVGTREGSVLWLDPDTGEVRTRIDADVDGLPLGSIADVTVGPEALFAVDALGPHVHVLSPTGDPEGLLGRTGRWIGTLAKPKSSAAGPFGTVIVGDSALGVMQLFDADGTPLGVIADQGVPLRIGHPIAVTHSPNVGSGAYLALDQDSGAVWGFTLSPETVEAARAGAGVRHLRYALVDPTASALEGGGLCFGCHDGTVNDDRYVWDPALEHHPVGVVPDRDLPPFFPLGDDGRIQCTTCHSPHGFSSVTEVRSVETPENLAALVRHAPEGELFTRMSREDSALCVGCHEDAAHERVLEEMGLPGTSHPVGSALARAMRERGGSGALGLPGGLGDSCLTCHAVHGADEPHLLRESTSGEACAACHEGQADPASNHPTGARVSSAERRRVAQILASIDAPVGPTGHDCTTCHDLVGGTGDALVRVLGENGRLCTTCHADKTSLEAHGDKVWGKPGGCVGCHDVHGASIDAHLVRTLGHATKGDPTGCRACHGKGRPNARPGGFPGALGHPVGVGDLTCRSCHDEHTPAQGVPSCGSCHEDQHAAELRGGHGRQACTDCHPVHAAADWALVSTQGLNPSSQGCLACHGPGGSAKRRVEAYEHPSPVFLPDGTRWTPLGKLPLFGPDGARLSPGDNGELTCRSCHVLHGPDPVKPGDKLRRPDWEGACSACHGAEALELYRYFHKPERRGAQP